jgi:hypothetical protein
MANLSKRIGLILSSSLSASASDYDLLVNNEKYSICFYDEITNHGYCDLIVTDKEPNNLSSLNKEQKDCHGIILIINKISNPILEQKYESIFDKSDSIKLKSIKSISKSSIEKLISTEILKQLAINNKISLVSFVFNKNILLSLAKNIFFSYYGILIIPYFLIIIYLAVSQVSSDYGYPLFSLCELIDKIVGYSPDCTKNNLVTLSFLALTYSFFNLKFYFSYILSTFNNINSEIFHNVLQKGKDFLLRDIFIQLILLVSSIIILKSLFIFVYGFEISKEYFPVNMELIFDKKVPFLKSDYLIYYFLSLDFCLYLITTNAINSKLSHALLSNKQRKSLKEAQKSFLISTLWDINVLFYSFIVLNPLLHDEQNRLAVQLIILQSIYIYINIGTIISDFKHN